MGTETSGKRARPYTTLAKNPTEESRKIYLPVVFFVRRGRSKGWSSEPADHPGQANHRGEDHSCEASGCWPNPAMIFSASEPAVAVEKRAARRKRGTRGRFCCTATSYSRVATGSWTA